jgi:hypothetical protein
MVSACVTTSLLVMSPFTTASLVPRVHRGERPRPRDRSG